MISSKGAIIVDGERAGIAFERNLPYPIEAVWEAISDPEQMSLWLGDTTIEGGMISVVGGPKHLPADIRRATGRILVCEPPRVMEYEWKQAIIEDSTVRFELTPNDGGTSLRLTHRWLSIANAGGFIPGWHAYLDRLAAHLGNGEVRDWSELFGEFRDLYAEHRSAHQGLRPSGA
ncbi:MAG: hypothetical protein JWQ98_2403 [Chlorobi bacterium]|nr:hypothetical protein [Chlorobiota bacterium]